MVPRHTSAPTYEFFEIRAGERVIFCFELRAKFEIRVQFSRSEEEEVISTSEIKEILGMWERVSQFVEKKHPEKVATSRASDLFNDTCLTHFRNILRGRKKQTSLDMFFSKRPTGESEKNVAKKAKTSEDI